VYTLIAFALLLGAGIFLWLRLEPLLRRLVALAEHKFALTEQSSGVREKRETIPMELVLDAMLENEEWARQDKLKKYQELYDEMGDWGKVQVIMASRAGKPV
jgi:hypothetical protein